MNVQESSILFSLLENGFTNQRDLADNTGFSLGTVNKALKILKQEGFIDEENKILATGKKFKSNHKVKNAVILAAGFGMRMVPINLEYPKGLLEYKGEKLIERLIEQLQEAGITEIHIVVGYMKEKFDYLIDKYGVNLIVNTEYGEKNNIHSLYLASEHIGNTYILPSDIWCKSNPFTDFEPHSWYMIGDENDDESDMYLNRKMELAKVTDNKHKARRLVGISYISEEEAGELTKNLAYKCKEHRFDQVFWEDALYNKDNEKFIITGKEISDEEVIEINTFEELRELESNSKQLETEAIRIIKDVFNIETEEIENIRVLKKGMTNRSFLFTCKGKQYIMRVPGEGTNLIINRHEEADVYNTIKGLDLCDEIVYIDADSGYKITEFIENARCCDPFDKEDLTLCIKKLRDFHNMKMKVNHYFDEFKVANFYESIWANPESMYVDYEDTKKKVFSLREYIDKHSKEPILSHFDANPDNFLMWEDESGKTNIRLIDWEYSSLHDPDIDLALMVIYTKYTKDEIDWVIDTYYEGKCDIETRIKIYCYISICGLLWSNWCEYKSGLGIEFGEYSLMQYRYAKDYYKIATEEMEKLNG